MAARSPKEIWPVEKLAGSFAQSGDSERAVARMKSFVAANPVWSNHVALVDFYRLLGRHAEALAEIRESLRLPEITEPLEDDHAEWSLFSLAGYAYGQKQYDLVLAIAQAWDDIDRQVGSGDQSFYARRGSRLSRQGNFGDAEKHYRRAARYAQRAGAWAACR